MPVKECQLCRSQKLELVLDLGMHPLADTFLKDEATAKAMERFPLQMLLCLSCGHVMNSYVVPKEKRYQETDYSYDSANSKAAVAHFDEMARDVIGKFSVAPSDLVVDIGGNIGTLLVAFKNVCGAKILNVEPSPNIADLAEKNGVPTVRDFWGVAAAQRVEAEGKAKVFAMTNVFNHIDDLDPFMQLIDHTLAPQGVFVIEVPYLLTLIERNAFDTAYLEHASYFAVKPLQQYFKKFDMQIMDVSHNDYMGGSLRIMIGKGVESPKVADYIAKEVAQHLFDPELYQAFRVRVEQFKMSLLSELNEAKRLGGKIIGIGAATKGNTLLNYCHIDSHILEFVTDASSLKMGKFTPGSAIPIKPDEAITYDITHALILPWNIADFLKQKLGPTYPNLAFIVPHMGSR